MFHFFGYQTKVMQNEQEKVAQRQESIDENTVWKLRDQPPADWSKPLPDFLTKGYKSSYLQIKMDEMKRSDESASSSSYNLCVIQ